MLQVMIRHKLKELQLENWSTMPSLDCLDSSSSPSPYCYLYDRVRAKADSGRLSFDSITVHFYQAPIGR